MSRKRYVSSIECAPLSLYHTHSLLLIRRTMLKRSTRPNPPVELNASITLSTRTRRHSCTRCTDDVGFRTERRQQLVNEPSIASLCSDATRRRSAIRSLVRAPVTRSIVIIVSNLAGGNLTPVVTHGKTRDQEMRRLHGCGYNNMHRTNKLLVD